ncbi:MAG: long-chain fatty acid--CoA ligase [Candidatus Aminicenantes bacterium]|nr:long-chain fatty acid--CoA ligase [Candidatus Aminicenantes bacterium]
MAETLSRQLLNILRSHAKDSLLSYKKNGAYVPISTAEFGTLVERLCLGLNDAGVKPKEKLVLLAENGPWWVMTDYANLCLGGVTVPVYTSLVPEQIRYIINDSKAATVVCGSSELWAKVSAVKKSLKSVRRWVLLEGRGPRGVLTLSELLERGAEKALRQPKTFERLASAVRPSDLASIVYTSGTTGVPKGVMLSHSNFASNINTLASIVGFSIRDTNLSFLPLSHVLARMVAFAFLSRGTSLAFAESIETVGENLLEVRPTILVTVPRLLEKIYGRILDTVLAGSGLKKKIFFWALRIGREHGALKLKGRDPGAWLRFRRRLAHRMVFAKVVAKTGGAIRFMVSGGAPLSKDIAEFFYALGLVVLEGYGLTETSPVISVNTFDHLRFGTVGRPIPGVEVRIARDGEILVRGPNVMRGYHQKPKETREVLKGGWLHTGDIGHLDEDGYLVITDRKKDLIITSGGKNVAPQPIENLFLKNPYFAQAVIVGGNRKFISALIVPEFEKLEAYARRKGLPFSNRSEMTASPAIREFFMSEIEKMTRHLAPYEKVKKIVLLEREFDIGRQELTPTLKVRRQIIELKYKKEINALYK